MQRRHCGNIPGVIEEAITSSLRPDTPDTDARGELAIACALRSRDGRHTMAAMPCRWDKGWYRKACALEALGQKAEAITAAQESVRCADAGM